ncbi:Ras-related protein Rab-21 [Entamoeba marina]
METEFKVVLLGEGKVGKTSMILRYTQNFFTPEEGPRTTQASYVSKTVTVDKTDYQINIWDTAGQEKYQALTPIYYRDADGALLVYDITEPRSFQRIETEVDNIREMLGEKCTIIIVGNKMDLVQQRKIDEADALKYTDSVGAAHMLCSCATGDGISNVFEELTKRMVNNNENHINDMFERKKSALVFQENDTNTKKNNDCC